VGKAKPTGSATEIEARLEQLRDADKELAKALAGTKDARRRVASELRTLQATLNWIRSGSQPQDAELYLGSIGDAVKVLLSRNGPMRVADLTRDLQEAGKLLRADSAYATLHKTLARDGRFEKVDGRRGYWKLA
jgi:phage gpG-like protein